jgi:hypothetical protein
MTRKHSWRFAARQEEKKLMNLQAHIPKIAVIAELAGVAAFTIGIISSVHHQAIGAFFVTGAALFAIGWKLRRW